MDQLKVFLRQCVKYRFWIAFGVALILPTIGYVVGAGTINTETANQEKAATGAKAEVGKYTTPGIVNGQYQPLAASKKEVLSQDVDATWRKLFATQEPLLKWPPEVQERFRKWGRKYPDVDQGQVQSTIIEYTQAYPAFVEKIYGVFKPFNFEDGSGIVVAPDWTMLLGLAKDFKEDSPPDLTTIWAEQERLWVVTAVLDAVAKINDGVGAKTWDDAVVKQINALEVGAANDQDQKSMAKGDTLVPADVLAAPGGSGAPAPPPSPTPGGGGEAGGMMGMGGGAGKSNEVLYLKSDSQQFKILPIKMTVLVDQARLPNYLVGLENSPMAIQVNEIELTKPKTPVAKPAYGEKSSFSFGGGMGGGMGMGMRDETMMMGGGGAAMGRAMSGNPYAGGGGPGGGRNSGSSSYEMMMRGAGGGGPGGGAAKTKAGIDNRNTNAAEERKKREKKEKDAAKAKTDTKKIDQYYNVVEVTIYGQARFYLAPPAAPAAQPSTAPAPEPAPTPASAAPKAEAPKPEAPKAETPAPSPTPKKDEAPKPESTTPKPEEAKPDAPAPKVDTPKAEPAKGEAPPPKA